MSQVKARSTPTCSVKLEYQNPATFLIPANCTSGSLKCAPDICCPSMPPWEWCHLPMTGAVTWALQRNSYQFHNLGIIEKEFKPISVASICGRLDAFLWKYYVLDRIQIFQIKESWFSTTHLKQRRLTEFETCGTVLSHLRPLRWNCQDAKSKRTEMKTEFSRTAMPVIGPQILNYSSR